MTIKKYSKSSAFYLSAKEDFFSSNNDMLRKVVEQNQLYSNQPKRVCCKLCQAALSEKVDFSSHGVEYVFCEKCNHLNGIYEDTQFFAEQLYMAEDGKEYASNYLDKSFEKRAIEVYLPKVDFLITTLPPKLNKILDVGCGSGYFVHAALLRNLEPKGIDVSSTMVEFGNSQIHQIFGSSPLELAEEDDFFEVIKNTDAEIVSAIGVIEHLREPQKFFEAFNQSNAKYLYYSVPMFSLSVALENMSSDVFPRQLSAGHTHLFTEESIAEMHRIMNISSIGEWRFGTDIMDLYRHLIVNLQSNDASQKMVDYLYDGLGRKIDALQNILDSNHSCSEIHVVAVKN
jgi:SAM-dependent methyltransferase